MTTTIETKQLPKSILFGKIKKKGNIMLKHGKFYSVTVILGGYKPMLIIQVSPNDTLQAAYIHADKVSIINPEDTYCDKPFWAEPRFWIVKTNNATLRTDRIFIEGGYLG